MSFWDTEECTITKDSASTIAELSCGFEVIPDGTVVVAAPLSAEWKEPSDFYPNRVIKIQWAVVDGEYKNRHIFHNVKVEDDKPSIREKHLKMLAAIDANSGGRMLSSDREPTDADLQSICNKPMELRLRVWEKNGKDGNWVEAVFPVGGGKKPSAPAKKADPKKSKPTDDFDDIPF